MKTKRSRQFLPVIASLCMCHLQGFAQAGANTSSSTEDEDVVVLSPFEVNTASDEGYIANQTNTGTIIAVAREEIPFNTSVITEGMIEDMALSNVSDISEVLAGVSRDNDPYIADEGGPSALGYRVRGFQNQPLYNGFQTGGRILTSNNLGRVEVSKGPNSVLYGQSPSGGVINFVPKQARFEQHASGTVGLGGNAWRTANFDAGAPIGAASDAKGAFRVGGGHLYHEREQIFFESEVNNLYGAFTWRFNDRVSLDVQAESVRLKIVPSRTPAFVSTGAGPDRVVDPFNRLRNDRNFTYNGPYSLNKRNGLISTAYLTVKLTDALTLRAGALYTAQDRTQTVLGNMYGLGTNESAPGARYSHGIGDEKTTAFKADLLHEGFFMNMKVKSLVGFELHEESGWGYSVRGEDGSAAVTIPFSRRPLVSDYTPVPPLSEFTVLEGDSESELDWKNVRFTQFLSSKEGRTTGMWGIAYGDGDTSTFDKRVDSTARSTGSDTTYTLGATHTVYEGDAMSTVNRVRIFGNYATSFQMQSGNQQNPADFDRFSTVEELRAYADTLTPNPIEPQTGNGYEFGVRVDMLDRKLGFTATYFDQTNENIARSFFVRESRVPGVDSEAVVRNFQLAGGKENSKGIELSMDWRPIESFIFTASAQLSEGEVLENPEVPEEVGSGLVQSPEDMFSFWSLYTFPEESSVYGLSVGLGASYNTPTRIRPQPNDRFRLSDHYTNARALVRYRFNAFNLSHAVALRVDNLLNQDYTTEANFLSEPRLWRLTWTTDW